MPDGEVGPAAPPCSLDFIPLSTPCLLKQAESLYWLKEIHRAVHVFPEESQVTNDNGGGGGGNRVKTLRKPRTGSREAGVSVRT